MPFTSSTAPDVIVVPALVSPSEVALPSFSVPRFAVIVLVAPVIPLPLLMISVSGPVFVSAVVATTLASVRSP